MLQGRPGLPLLPWLTVLSAGSTVDSHMIQPAPSLAAPPHPRLPSHPGNRGKLGSRGSEGQPRPHLQEHGGGAIPRGGAHRWVRRQQVVQPLNRMLGGSGAIMAVKHGSVAARHAVLDAVA